MNQIEYILTASGSFIAAIIFNVVRNHKLILQKNAVNHTKEWVIKALTCLPAVLLFASASNLKWIAALVVSSFMIIAHFWVWFDGFLNLRRKHNFFFAGSDDGKGDAGTDNLIEDLPLWLIAIIKIGIMSGVTYLYIIGCST